MALATGAERDIRNRHRCISGCRTWSVRRMIFSMIAGFHHRGNLRGSQLWNLGRRPGHPAQCQQNLPPCTHSTEWDKVSSSGGVRRLLDLLLGRTVAAAVQNWRNLQVRGGPLATQQLLGTTCEEPARMCQLPQRCGEAWQNREGIATVRPGDRAQPRPGLSVLSPDPRKRLSSPTMAERHELITSFVLCWPSSKN